MKATAVWENGSRELDDTAASPVETEERASQGSITALRDLTFRLLREVQSISEVHTLDLESGFDFYDEVRRFEIDLIKRALLRTAGHQGRAAQLLNLKVTTLNTKIKHYNIQVESFAIGHGAMQPPQLQTQQHA